MSERVERCRFAASDQNGALDFTDSWAPDGRPELGRGTTSSGQAAVQFLVMDVHDAITRQRVGVTGRVYTGDRE